MKTIAFFLALLCASSLSAAKSYIGLSTLPVHPATASQVGLEKNRGLVVQFIAPDSPAAKAGLKHFDILLSVNKQILHSGVPLKKTLELFKPGDAISIELLRKGKPMTVKLVLGNVKERKVPRATLAIDLEVLMAKQLAQQKQLSDKELRKLIKQMEGDMIKKILEESSEGKNTFEAHTVIQMSDEKHHIHVHTSKKHRRALVKTLKGEVIFNGPINNDEEMKKLPKEVEKKIRDLLKQFQVIYEDK